MAFAPSNRISYVLPEEDKPPVDAAIQTLQEKLKPRLVDLGPDEIRALPKMGDKTVQFVNKTFHYARENPEFSPAFVDLEEFERDLLAVDELRALQRPLSQLADMVSDSLLLSGSEAYMSALAYYKSVKEAAKRGHPGAAVIVEDLSTQFPNRAQKPAAASAAELPQGTERGAAA